MSVQTAQYSHPIKFTATLADETAWEQLLLEIGLEREAFSLTRADDESEGMLLFWEPDRVEALRYLARLQQSS